MSESPVLVEAEGRELFGVVTRPEDGREAGGVLFLAGVGIAAAGNARVFVRSARALAEAGHVALRLDCHGFGDSWSDIPHPPPGQPRTADALAGLAWLTERTEPVVVVGECHGARSALAAAAAGGVREVIALFPPLWDLDEDEQAADGDAGFLDDVRAATAQGAHVHVLYGEGDRDLPYFQRSVEGPLADLAAGGAVTSEVAAERLHGIASAVAADHVLAAIEARVVGA